MTGFRVGIGLIGPGNFGRRLATALRADPRVELTAVLGESDETTRRAATELGAHPARTIEELLERPGLQGVVIATPTPTHRDLVLAAAAAGKHVFCEKPMSLTAGACDEMVAACAAARISLFIGHVQRFFPVVAETVRLLHAGEIGAPVAIETHRHDLLKRSPESWLSHRQLVGGLLHQSTVHEFDWLRTAVGDIACIFAAAGKSSIQKHLDFPDSAALSVSFASGCIASVSACMSSFLRNHAATVFGEAGALSFDLTVGRLSIGRTDGTVMTVEREEFRFDPGHEAGIRHELRAFVDSVLGVAAPVVPGEEGTKAVEAAQAALLSAARGQSVALPLPPEDRYLLPEK